MIIKRVPAPEWFVVLWSELQSSRQQTAELLGYGLHWLEKANPDKIRELTENLNRVQRQKFYRHINYGSALKNYAFEKFRIEILKTDPDMANAESLSYDQEKAEIVLKAGVLDHLISGVKKLLDDSGIKAHIHAGNGKL